MFRILFLFFFLFFFLEFRSLLAQSPAMLVQPLTISFKDDSLARAVLRLQTKSKISFAFDPETFNGLKPVSGSFIAVPLLDILKKIFFGTGIVYELYGSQLVIVRKRISRVTINGYLRDKNTGEELIGANVFVPQFQTGVTTNQYGFYSLTLPEGNYELSATHIGYQTEKRNLHLDSNQTIIFELKQRSKDLEEIVIDARTSMRSLTSNYSLNVLPAQINRLPFYAGEEDVIKALQMQNGIRAMTEGSSGLFIRGGNMDQNLIMLDEALIYNPSHLFGLVSIFNPDAIKNVEVYRDYIPPNFGGRLSSVIDNRMTEGNNRELQVKGGVSLLSARLAIEGPTTLDKGSFLMSFRRSLLDMTNFRFHLVDHKSTYYDVNAKTNYQLNKNNRFLYSFYFGDDYLFSKNSYSNNWGNLASTLRWNHVFNSQLFLNVSAIYSNYKNLLDVNADTLSEKYQWKTGVKDLGLKSDFTLYRSPENRIRFGVSGTWHRFIPGETTNGFPGEFNIARDQSLEYAGYLSQQISLCGLFEADYGMRATVFQTGEDRNDIYDEFGNKVKLKDRSTYIGLDPRINLILNHNRGRVRLTYNHTSQYVQLIQNNELAFSSLETWLPASVSVKPQRSDHWSLAYEYLPEKYTASVSVYYKKLYNQYELTDHAQVIQNPLVRQELRKGISDAYGAEFNITRISGNLTGNLSYIYSRAFKKIRGINDGNRFAANFDIPNELKLAMEYKTHRNVSFNSYFTYASGRPLTLPVGYYFHDNIQVPIYEGRNTSRYPEFVRLDMSVQYQILHQGPGKRGINSNFSAGIYNVFDRKNPLFYRLKQVNRPPDIPIVEYGSGIFPWIAYSFKI